MIEPFTSDIKVADRLGQQLLNHGLQFLCVSGMHGILNMNYRRLGEHGRKMLQDLLKVLLL